MANAVTPVNTIAYVQLVSHWSQQQQQCSLTCSLNLWPRASECALRMLVTLVSMSFSRYLIEHARSQDTALVSVCAKHSTSISRCFVLLRTTT
jgi:hypothetical protein